MFLIRVTLFCKTEVEHRSMVIVCRDRSELNVSRPFKQSMFSNKCTGCPQGIGLPPPGN